MAKQPAAISVAACGHAYRAVHLAQGLSESILDSKHSD